MREDDAARPEPIPIEYRFKLSADKEVVFRLVLDPETLVPIGNVPDNLPRWTRLEVHQCPNCPLTAADTRHCPAAAHMVGLVQRFAQVLSHEAVEVDVVTKERCVSQRMAAQRGIGSLMGLIMAVSGCPNMTFFRPMARFHVPWASEQETMFRAASSYLLTKYMIVGPDSQATLELDGLVRVYKTVHEVNRAFIERLHAADSLDSIVNALVILDTYTLTLPFAVRNSLEELRHLFE
jgi:hypothetical protein